MQAAAFLAFHGGADHQFRHLGQVAQLDQVAADLVVAVELVDLVQQQPHPVLRPRQALVGAHDPHVVPHEAPQFVPVVGDDHVFVRIGDLARIPAGQGGRHRDARQLFENVRRRRAGVDEAFEQRIAGHAVGAVQAGEAGFANRIQAGHIGAPVLVDHHAAAGVVRCRHHRDRAFGDVDIEGQAAFVNGREVGLDEGFGLVADVQVDAVDAQALHFMVDGAGDDIPWCQLGTRVEALHEAFAIGQFQVGAFAAQGFGDQAAHSVAMNQLRGGFSTELNVLREQLIHFASMIELELDFSEEDVEFANRDQLQELINKITLVINKLIRSFELGNVIKEGINTVIAGRPNAGKSTLLNALLNEDRAIVSEIAGTTRDTIEEVLNINGINFRLIDTAGIREATDTIEAIGVEKTMQKISQSAVLVYLFDVVNLSASEIREDIQSLHKPGIAFIAVANKIDLSFTDRVKELGLPSDINFISISAKENQQIEELKQLLYDTAVGDKLSTNHTMVTNIRHVEALQKTRTALDSVVRGLTNPVTSDFLAMDIKQALYYLGEITGQVTTDDLLENIFSKFCIGK